MRKITIRLGDYVEEEKRRERRGGRAVAAAAIVVALVIVMLRATTPPPNGTTGQVPTAAHLASLPATLTFAPQLAGTASDAQLVRLRNDGDGMLSIGRIEARGDAFRLTYDCAGTLAGHDSCTAAVVFAPAATGPQKGTLAIETSGGAAAIALDGTAKPVPSVPVPAQLAPLPPAMTFGVQLAGTASPAQLVRIRNAGDEPLSIASLGAHGDAFRISHDCLAALAKSESCSAAVVFAPSLAGPQQSELTVETNGGKAAIALSGTARPIPPVDLGLIDFGSAVVKTPRPPRPIRFANSRPAPIVLGKSILSGPFAAVFDRCSGARLDSGGHCDATLALNTPAVGAFRGQLRLVDAQGSVVAFSALSGATTAPPIVEVPQPQPQPPASPPKIDIEPRRVAFTANTRTKRPIVITNRGERPVTIGIKVNGVPFGFIVDTKPCHGRTLMPNEPCTMTVTALPVAYERHSSMQILVSYEGRTETIGVAALR